MCQRSMLEVMSSDDEDDVISSDHEEGEHNVLNVFLDVVAQDSSGTLVGSFLEDW